MSNIQSVSDQTAGEICQDWGKSQHKPGVHEADEMVFCLPPMVSGQGTPLG